MDKVIVTVLLIIGGVVASLAVFNGVYPAIVQSSSSVTSATAKVSGRIETRIDIIQVSDNSTLIDFWVKNTGTARIVSIDRSDIFYGPETDFTRITYGGSTPPYWDHVLEGSATEWTQAVTLKGTIHLESAIAAGTYLLKMVTPNGINDQITFGVD